MILTITLNAALDLTYQVPSLTAGTTHRVEHVHGRAGGKGINVARVLHTFGYDVIAGGLVGGMTGEDLRADLDQGGVGHGFTTIAGESRRSVAVTARDTGDATVFNELGPTVTAEEWARFERDLESLLPSVDLVVGSGSLPPGVPEDAYGRLVRLARQHGVETIIDSHGAALIATLPYGPLFVKPNRAELLALTGVNDPLVGTAQLRALGAQTVVTSLGPDGLYVDGPSGRWRAVPGAPQSGNPTGAGDACVAAIAAGFLDAVDAPTWAIRAVAWSAAAVLSPYAGQVDPPSAARLQANVKLEELHAVHIHR